MFCCCCFFLSKITMWLSYHIQHNSIIWFKLVCMRVTGYHNFLLSPWAKELRNAKSPEDIIWRLHKKAWTSLCLCTEEHLCNLPLHFLSIPLTTSYLWKVRVLINYSLSKVAHNCHIKFELAVSDFNLICCESFVIYCEWFELVVNGLNLL